MPDITLRCANGDSRTTQRFCESHTEDANKSTFMLTLLVNCGIYPAPGADGSEWSTHMFFVSPIGAKGPACPSLFTGLLLYDRLCRTVALADGADPIAPELPGFNWSVWSMTARQPSTTKTEGPARSSISDRTTAQKLDKHGVKLRGGIHMCDAIRLRLWQLPSPYAMECEKTRAFLNPDHLPNNSWLGINAIRRMATFAQKVRFVDHHI